MFLKKFINFRTSKYQIHLAKSNMWMKTCSEHSFSDFIRVVVNEIFYDKKKSVNAQKCTFSSVPQFFRTFPSSTTPYFTKNKNEKMILKYHFIIILAFLMFCSLSYEMVLMSNMFQISIKHSGNINASSIKSINQHYDPRHLK